MYVKSTTFAEESPQAPPQVLSPLPTKSSKALAEPPAVKDKELFSPKNSNFISEVVLVHGICLMLEGSEYSELFPLLS